MSKNKELADYIMDQLSDLENVRNIPMMGGYIFYYKERIFVGIYGNGLIDPDKMAEIPLGLESVGTLKMFALYPKLQEVLEKGSVFFIDELNARFHPLFVRNFLLAFLNPKINNNHAQLVFTIHDTWQLLRSNEIWFVEKDERDEVYQHFTHWMISWMRMVPVSVRMKAVRRIT
jgi:hypothetical protein